MRPAGVQRPYRDLSAVTPPSVPRFEAEDCQFVARPPSVPPVGESAPTFSGMIACSEARGADTGAAAPYIASVVAKLHTPSDGAPRTHRQRLASVRVPRTRST